MSAGVLRAVVAAVTVDGVFVHLDGYTSSQGAGPLIIPATPVFGVLAVGDRLLVGAIDGSIDDLALLAVLA